MCNRSVFGYIFFLLGGLPRNTLTDRQTDRQTDRHKVIELVDDVYKMRFTHIQVRSTGIRACGNKN